jgi:hypothetical protein
MNEAVTKKIRVWDDLIEYKEPTSNAKAEKIKAAITVRLIAFDRHKKELLAVLRKAYKRGSKSDLFDANQSWRHLRRVASFYFWRDTVKQEMMSDANRIGRLRELAKAFRKAHDLVDDAMPNDVGNDLRWAWWQGTREYARAKGRFVDFLYIERKFEKVVTSLIALEAAAVRAADDVPRRRGRPRANGILPPGDIEGLAAVYRDITRSRPGAGGGPFAKFVSDFLTAVGRGNIQYDSVIDAIKDARRRALEHAPGTRWGPSPFDKECEEAE